MGIRVRNSCVWNCCLMYHSPAYRPQMVLNFLANIIWNSWSGVRDVEGPFPTRRELSLALSRVKPIQLIPAMSFTHPLPKAVSHALDPCTPSVVLPWLYCFLFYIQPWWTFLPVELGKITWVGTQEIALQTTAFGTLGCFPPFHFIVQNEMNQYLPREILVIQ